MTYTPAWHTICLVVLVSSILGCVSTKTIDREISAWMACLDCGPDADERVKALGEKALPALVKIVVTPTTPADLERAKNQLRGLYRELASQKAVKLGWTEDEYVEYYLGSIDTRRLRAAYAILLICQPPNRCDQIRPMANGFPAFAKELATKRNQEIYLRIVAQYPR